VVTLTARLWGDRQERKGGDLWGWQTFTRWTSTADTFRCEFQ
jgi:hypothetical protein